MLKCDSNLFSFLTEIASSPGEYLREMKREAGVKVIGSVSSWIPAEIIEAAGAVFFRVPFFSTNFFKSGAHIQSNVCAFAKGFLEMGLKGNLDFLDAVVFPSLCDTVQGLGDIWREAIKNIPAINFYMPVNMVSSASLNFLESEIKDFARKISAITKVEVTDSRLKEAIDLWSRRRKVVRSFYSLTAFPSSPLTMVEKYAVIRGADLIPLEKIDKLMNFESLDVHDVNKTPVFLVGSVLPFPSFFKLLDDLSIYIVDDYICSGRAFWGYDDGSDCKGDESPWVFVAKGLLSRTAGAVKFNPDSEGKSLVDRIKKSGMKNILWVTQKFCDPWAWQYSILEKILEKMGCRVLRLEISDVAGEEAMLKTRLESFVQVYQMGMEFYR